MPNPSQTDMNPITLQDLCTEQMTPQELAPISRRSVRQMTRPVWLDDYEPRNYQQAKQGNEWVKAMQAEITALERNNTLIITRATDAGLISLLLYVDDILVTGPSKSHITGIKGYLDQLFTIKDLGEAKYFLGLEIARSSQGLIVTQTKYMNDLVTDMGQTQAKFATPLPVGVKLTIDAGGVLQDPSQYRRLIGRVLYLGYTRLDISHATQQLSQFIQCPCQQHWKAVVHLVCYIKGSLFTGLFFPFQNDLALTTFSNVDWVACLDSRKSLIGYCLFLGSAPVSWKTKKQNTLSRSTVEAEYRSMASAFYELTWLTYLLTDFGVTVQLPVPFFYDNKAALHIIENPVFYERTKHLEIDCHIVRDKFKDGLIQPTFIRSKLQLIMSNGGPPPIGRGQRGRNHGLPVPPPVGDASQLQAHSAFSSHVGFSFLCHDASLTVVCCFSFATNNYGTSCSSSLPVAQSITDTKDQLAAAERINPGLIHCKSLTVALLLE
ncbi:UNVERIFIED_CONTAM: Retrovirus-related Pol polyprotein from transposon RE2 [Sesamum latifolium]|uniref:Retrovirus-related Pol polyprotein from transposon RE2 n=1 Tax=Sesamum latifolium TaxID=2727402 RepID=A0AAW2XU04_9LAMI